MNCKKTGIGETWERRKSWLRHLWKFSTNIPGQEAHPTLPLWIPVQTVFECRDKGAEEKRALHAKRVGRDEGVVGEMGQVRMSYPPKVLRDCGRRNQTLPNSKSNLLAVGQGGQFVNLALACAVDACQLEMQKTKTCINRTMTVCSTRVEGGVETGARHAVYSPQYG